MKIIVDEMPESGKKCLFQFNMPVDDERKGCVITKWVCDLCNKKCSGLVTLKDYLHSVKAEEDE